MATLSRKQICSTNWACRHPDRPKRTLLARHDSRIAATPPTTTCSTPCRERARSSARRSGFVATESPSRVDELLRSLQPFLGGALQHPADHGEVDAVRRKGTVEGWLTDVGGSDRRRAVSRPDRRVDSSPGARVGVGGHRPDHSVAKPASRLTTSSDRAAKTLPSARLHGTGRVRTPACERPAVSPAAQPDRPKRGMAGTQGFEPRFRGPEPRVLPLNDVPAGLVSLTKRRFHGQTGGAPAHP